MLAVFASIAYADNLASPVEIVRSTKVYPNLAISLISVDDQNIKLAFNFALQKKEGTSLLPHRVSLELFDEQGESQPKEVSVFGVVCDKENIDPDGVCIDYENLEAEKCYPYVIESILSKEEIGIYKEYAFDVFSRNDVGDEYVAKEFFGLMPELQLTLKDSKSVISAFFVFLL